MPLYEFQCPDCGTRFEKLVRATTAQGGIACPSCRSTQVERQFSTFATNYSAGRPVRRSRAAEDSVQQAVGLPQRNGAGVSIPANKSNVPDNCDALTPSCVPSLPRSPRGRGNLSVSKMACDRTHRDDRWWRRTSPALRVPDNGGKGSLPRPSVEWRKAKQGQERDGESSVGGATALPDNIPYSVTDPTTAATVSNVAMWWHYRARIRWLRVCTYSENR